MFRTSHFFALLPTLVLLISASGWSDPLLAPSFLLGQPVAELRPVKQPPAEQQPATDEDIKKPSEQARKPSARQSESRIRTRSRRCSRIFPQILPCR